MNSQKNIVTQITGSTLKIIATISMLMDHITAALLDRYLVNQGFHSVSFFNITKLSEYGDLTWLAILVLVGRMIGRLALPIYCFLLVEGFLHTRDVKKYIERLLAFALISEIPFNLANGQHLWYPTQQNVFFGLVIGVLCLAMYKWVDGTSQKYIKLLSKGGIAALAVFILYLLSGAKWAGVPILQLNSIVSTVLLLVSLGISTLLYLVVRKKKSSNIADRRFAKLLFLIATMLLAVVIQSDYSFGIVACTTIMYVFRNKKVKASGLGILSLIFVDPSEFTALIALFLIGAYNGKRGLKMKYFFYLFYPVHLTIIAMLSFWIFR